MPVKKYLYKTPLSTKIILGNTFVVALFFYALINISENIIVISILDSLLLLFLFFEKNNILVIKNDQMTIQNKRGFPFLIAKSYTFAYNEIESIEIINGEGGNPFFFLFGLYSAPESPKITIVRKKGDSLTFEVDCGYDSLSKAINIYNKVKTLPVRARL